MHWRQIIKWWLFVVVVVVVVQMGKRKQRITTETAETVSEFERQ